MPSMILWDWKKKKAWIKKRRMDAERQANWQINRWMCWYKIKGDRNWKGKAFVANSLWGEGLKRSKGMKTNRPSFDICTLVCLGCNGHHQCFRMDCSMWPKGETMINITTWVWHSFAMLYGNLFLAVIMWQWFQKIGSDCFFLFVVVVLKPSIYRHLLVSYLLYVHCMMIMSCINYCADYMTGINGSTCLRLPKNSTYIKANLNPVKIFLHSGVTSVVTIRNIYTCINVTEI